MQKGNIVNNTEWEQLLLPCAFSEYYLFRFCAKLIPVQEKGALETFIVDMLQNVKDPFMRIENKKMIDQVDVFLKNFHSETYLKKRRERIKSRLSVTLSIISPDRTFSTINEILQSIAWDKYDTYNKQFLFLKEI